jgi:polyhydroxyalkanoate synthase
MGVDARHGQNCRVWIGKIEGMDVSPWFELLDQLRRIQGDVMDCWGLGPTPSEYQLVLETYGLRLRCYAKGSRQGPPLLIVPAPIKRSYIWDLAPQRSVVRRAVAHGLGVYLVEWVETYPQSGSPGLADYAGHMLAACVDAAIERSGFDKVILAGHSLGGVFAALHAAYRPEHIAGLVLVEVPLEFNKAGAFQSVAEQYASARQTVPATSAVPGSYLSLLSAQAAPDIFYANRFLDGLASMASRDKLATHLRVERWTMDELPMSRNLFEDVVQRLYRENAFMRGEFAIDGVKLHPSRITAPLLSVFRPSSTLISAASVLAFHHAAGSREKELVPYFGDVGVALQHVGALVGDSAHRRVWPRVFNWIDRITGKGQVCPLEPAVVCR